MTDKELLELAAKAAGIELKPMQINNVTKQGDDRFIGYMTNPQEWSRGWFDPLKDDGDAMRLAVKLKIHTHTGFGISILDAPDPYAATRRAIVRAAAEIGKGMK
jgi:hypothetical protein